MRVWLRRILVVTSFFILLLTCVNLVTFVDQKDDQNAFAQDLLTHAELVTVQLTDALQAISEQGISKCNQASIDELRTQTNSFENVYDLGLVVDGEVTCTANWGVLLNPVILPKAQYISPTGFEIYSHLGSILPLKDRFDVTKLENVIALTVQNPFKQFTDRNPKFSFDIRTKAQNHVFMHYRPQSPQPMFRLPWSSKTTLCSDKFTYCVNIYNKRVGLAFYETSTILHILGLCFLASLLLKYSLRSFLDKRQSMEFRFRRAISQRKLYMEYQPILEASTGKLVGVESLIRWRDDRYGFVSPELFLNIAEELKLYPKVAHFTIETSISEMAPLLSKNPHFSLALNVNTYEINDEYFLQELYALACEYQVRPAQIKIEITERIAVPLDELSQFSQRAKAFGFHIALDDFGTGVSNLVWLTEIDFDVIKIDRVFTQALSNDFKKNMVFAILDLLSGLEKQIIFEGVETEQELNMIIQSCPYAHVQGWYFYKSLTKRDLYLMCSTNVNEQSDCGLSMS